MNVRRADQDRLFHDKVDHFGVVLDIVHHRFIVFLGDAGDEVRKITRRQGYENQLFIRVVFLGDAAHHLFVRQRREVDVVAGFCRNDDVVFFQKVGRDARAERFFEHDVFGRQLQDRLDQIGVAQEAVAHQNVADTLAGDAAFHHGGFHGLAVGKALLHQIVADALVALQADLRNF